MDTQPSFDELRRVPAALENVIQYTQFRLEQLHKRLAMPLLNERESDMVRGRIAELKLLLASMQSTGEVDE